jgi:5'-3' exonuclease
MTEAMGIPTYESDGFEADDIMGTVAMKMWSRGYPVVIVTGDKDLAQLVREGVWIYDMANEAWLDEARVRERYGVYPCQIPDLLALRGDSVDNIPGVEGIGPKIAQQILSVCMSVEDVAIDDAILDSVEMRSRSKIIRKILNSMETGQAEPASCHNPLRSFRSTSIPTRSATVAAKEIRSCRCARNWVFSGILEEIPLARAGALL